MDGWRRSRVRIRRPHWTAKAEYLYVDLGKFNCGAGCAAGALTDNVSFTTNLIRGGINYRF